MQKFFFLKRTTKILKKENAKVLFFKKNYKNIKKRKCKKDLKKISEKDNFIFQKKQQKKLYNMFLFLLLLLYLLLLLKIDSIPKEYA